MNSSETLSQLVGQTLTGVAEDLAAARLAVRDGVARLTGNFYEFRERLKLQGEELQAVARTLEGNQAEGGSGFIRDMNGIVTRFVDDLVMVSASSVRLVQRVDGYRATLKRGQVTYRDGVVTGALPGKLVRGPQRAARA